MASATIEFLQKQYQCPAGVPQEGKGRNYKGSEFTLEALLSSLLRRALLPGVNRPREQTESSSTTDVYDGCWSYSFALPCLGAAVPGHPRVCVV